MTYSIVKHRASAVAKKEEYTIQMFDELLERFHKEGLDFYELTDYHVQVVEEMIKEATIAKKEFKDNFVEMMTYWTREVQYENVLMLIKKELDNGS